MESLQIIRLWAAAAWADGKLHPAEAAALGRYIDASDDLQGDDRVAAFKLLHAKPIVAVEEVQALSRPAREGVYRAVLGIVRLDGQVTPDEVDWVARLRARLNLDADVIAGIDKGAGGAS
jgi:tellurite resistance protein TerB